MKLELTKEEAQTLIDLIDLAIKSPSGGLRVSRQANALADKIADAAQALPEKGV